MHSVGETLLEEKIWALHAGIWDRFQEHGFEARRYWSGQHIHHVDAKGSTSGRRASASASTANLLAWYAPPPRALTRPAFQSRLAHAFLALKMEFVDLSIDCGIFDRNVSFAQAIPSTALRFQSRLRAPESHMG